MPRPLIIVGASTRAAAQSAKRAGYDPWCIDRFADVDLRRIADARLCPPGQYPQAIPDLLRDAPDGPILLTGAMENHLDVVRSITERFPLLGSDADAMALAREPWTLATCRRLRHVHPCPILTADTMTSRLAWRLTTRFAPGRYLCKSHRSAGGSGVREPRRGEPLDEHHYLQRRVDGVPLSAVFFTDGWSARLLGVTRQIIGDAAFAAQPFHYCGSLWPFDLSDEARHDLSQLGAALAQRCDLRGLFGVDLILQCNGILRPVEINPRYTASIEVIERGADTPLLLPNPFPAFSGKPTGKAVLFAKANGVVPDFESIVPDGITIADIPAPGSRLFRHQPICTLLTQADSTEDCLARLRNTAQQVYTRLSS
ncbi:MAG: ATP-grasp domain-containing protein [Phycisphaeraceae bacterium]|nr:ATP-grasp domain-containing protein [Phycisphaeraceae bacterium]